MSRKEIEDLIAAGESEASAIHTESVRRQRRIAGKRYTVEELGRMREHVMRLHGDGAPHDDVVERLRVSYELVLQTYLIAGVRPEEFE